MASLRLTRDSGPPIEVLSERSVLGRDAGCDVVVDDKSVSRRHVLLERRGEEWAVVDQGSVNGTFLDGSRVAEAVLRDGQQLRLGTVVFRVGIEEEAAATVLMAASELEDATVLMAHPELAPAAAASRTIAPPPVAAPPVQARAEPVPPRPSPAVPPLPASVPAGRGAEEEALQLLGLPPGASPEELRARYDELSRDLHVKLAGARTPNLKHTYEKNLAALDKAYRQLARGPVPIESIAADLPSAQPVLGAELMAEPTHERPEPEEDLEEAAHAKGVSVLPKATSFFVFLATGLLALLAFFGLSSTKLATTVRKAEESADLQSARQAAARYAPVQALLRSGALRNGKLRLCNHTQQAIEIEWLSVVSLRKDILPPVADRKLAEMASGFKVATYNSGFCGRDFKISLAPGAEQAVEMRSQDPRCQFDGQALFYALSVQRRAAGAQVPAEAAPAPGVPARKAARSDDSETTYWQAGLLDGKDQCVSVGAGR